MPQLNETSTPEAGRGSAGAAGRNTGLEIAPADLAALSKQLRLLDALERDELQHYPPILKMDADWHD